MRGPGKYDHIATMAIEAAQATGVVVIVFNGDRGNGFSVQADAATLAAMPDILQSVVNQLRTDLAT